MKMKYLFGACMLLGGLASCTSDEIASQGGGIDVPGNGAVVFSLEGLGSGSVESPGTRAILATQEENRIDSLDVYVFAYDNDGTFDEDLTVTTPAVIAQLTPDDAATADETKWYLQEKWTWKNPEPGRSSGMVDTSRPQLHEIPQLGGSGVARTAVIYPERGRFLKFFIVANGGELTATAAETVYTPAFTDANTGAAGTSASDFLNLRLRLGIRPADPAQVLSIECPLPMTSQMATTKAAAVDMTKSANPVQVTRGATLTRAVARFDVVNYAALPAQGDYTLTDVIVSNHYAFTNMQNLVPAGATMKESVKKNLDGRTWGTYTDLVTGEQAMQLQSVFYTSPTLAGTDPMKLGLRGVLGKSTAQPGELLTPLNKDVDVLKDDGTSLVLTANTRYLLKIKKLGSDINVAFSIEDWDSKILDADFSNAPMPKLICEDATGITWNVADPDMNKHFVEMANTAVGGRLAFELGTYTEDELADLLLDPTDTRKIPFHAEIVSLNDNPAFPDDNIWLTRPIVTYDPLKRDRFNVVLDIRPESEVPLSVRPDLMVMIVNKEHVEKQLFFRITSAWQAPARPQDVVVVVGDFNVAVGDNTPSAWQAAVDNTPADWLMPTVAHVNHMAGVTLTATPQTVTDAKFLKAFPDQTTSTRTASGTSYWLADEDGGASAFTLVVSGNQASIVSQEKITDSKVRYVQILKPIPDIDTANPSVTGDYSVASLVDPAFTTGWQTAVNGAKGNYKLPTRAVLNHMAGISLTGSGVTVNNSAFLAAFPDNSGGTYGTSYWLSDEDSSTGMAYCLTVQGTLATVDTQNKTASLRVRYFKFDTPEFSGLASTLIALGGDKTPVYVAPVNTYNDVQFKYANFAPDGAGMCPAGWNVPTKDEVMAIFGMTGTEWPEDVSTDILKGWPAGTYWTQTRYNDTRGWSFTVMADGKVTVEKKNEDTSAAARCVKMKN